MQTDLGDHILPEQTGPQIILPFGLNVTKHNQPDIKGSVLQRKELSLPRMGK